MLEHGRSLVNHLATFDFNSTAITTEGATSVNLVENGVTVTVSTPVTTGLSSGTTSFTLTDAQITTLNNNVNSTSFTNAIAQTYISAGSKAATADLTITISGLNAGASYNISLLSGCDFEGAGSWNSIKSDNTCESSAPELGAQGIAVRAFAPYTISSMVANEDGNIVLTVDNSNGSHTAVINALAIAKVPASTKATVTYKYVVDGTPITYTTSNEQVVGQAPAQPASYDFATTTSDAASKTVATDGSTVVNVTVTQELPFGVGNKDDQFLHRGFLHVHSNQGRYMYFDYDDEAEAQMVYDTENYEAGSGLNKKLTTDFPKSASTCKWHITGNVVEGFKLYNDTYDMVLSATAPQASMLSLYDPANGENPGTAFVLKRSTAGVGEFNFKRGFCLYAPERSQYLNAQTKMMYWTAADAGSTFEFEESYDVTIGEAGLATLYYHTPLSLDNVEGLTAYTLTLEGDYLVANETSTIPAYTGVVLAGEAKTYTLPVAFENVPGMGALTGSYTEKNTPANCYVLSKNGGDACFAKYTGAKVGEFKAYFIGEAASASNIRISFGELNSIISAAKENGGQAIFDLQGRRVVNAQNGLYIINGKKVIK